MIKDILAENQQSNEFFFIENYKELIYPYIASGRPSQDTLRTYYSAIDQFIEYCDEKRILPMHVTEYDMLQYRESLYKREYQDSTVSAKMAALRKFYHVAVKMKAIKTNPLADVKSSFASKNNPLIKYLTKETLQTVISSLLTRSDLKDIRDTAIFVMMALEGLRTVEIHRMNEEDIDFANGIINIKGKGHVDPIYPREDTMKILRFYLERKEMRTTNELVHPVFVSHSNHNMWNRISRDGIRRAIDNILKEFGIKKHGISCHVLRHTCATLLYAETKDLQIIKETLRHKSIQMSSKYAHLQDRMSKRYTNAIPIQINEETKLND